MRYYHLGFVLCIFLFVLSGCGGGGGNHPSVQRLDEVTALPSSFVEQDPAPEPSPREQDPPVTNSPPATNQASSNSSSSSSTPPPPPPPAEDTRDTNVQSYGHWINEQMTELRMTIDGTGDEERIIFPRYPQIGDNLNETFFLHATYSGGVFGKTFEHGESRNADSHERMTGTVVFTFNPTFHAVTNNQVAVDFSDNLPLLDTTLTILPPAAGTPWWSLTSDGNDNFAVGDIQRGQTMNGDFWWQQRNILAGTVFSTGCSDGSCNAFDGYYQAVRE